jgi:hypothetical protein
MNKPDNKSLDSQVSERVKYFCEQLIHVCGTEFMDVNINSFGSIEEKISNVALVCVRAYHDQGLSKVIDFDELMESAEEALKTYLLNNFSEMGPDDIDYWGQAFFFKCDCVDIEMEEGSNEKEFGYSVSPLDKMNRLDCPVVLDAENRDIFGILALFPNVLSEVDEVQLRLNKDYRKIISRKAEDSTGLASLCAMEYPKLSNSFSVDDYIGTCTRAYMECWYNIFGDGRDSAFPIHMAIFENKLKLLLELQGDHCEVKDMADDKEILTIVKPEYSDVQFFLDEEISEIREEKDVLIFTENLGEFIRTKLLLMETNSEIERFYTTLNNIVLCMADSAKFRLKSKELTDLQARCFRELLDSIRRYLISK